MNNKTNKQIENNAMNKQPEFSQNRKDLIAFMKSRLTDPKNLKREMDCFGNKRKNLRLIDYVVYACLRGADYNKACHDPYGQNLSGYLYHMATGQINRKWWIGRYVENEDQIEELVSILAESRFKYAK